ncbi:MAG: ABC transporter ATP-binding protein [Bacteroidota bacterium]
MNTDTNRYSNLYLMQRILKLASPYRYRLLAVLFISLLSASSALLTPYHTQYALDHAILKTDYDLLQRIITMMIVVLVINAILSYAFTYHSGWLGQSIISRLRVHVFKHILNNNLTYFDHTPVGTSTTRTINDIESVNQIFSEGVLNILSDLLTITAIMSFMFYTSWTLSLVALSVLPLLLIAAYIFKEGVRKSFTEVRNQVTRINTFIQEHITGNWIVQLFNAESRELDKFKEINEAHKQANIRSIFYYSVFFPVVEIISSLSLGAMLWYWSGSYVKGQITLGEFNSFILCINMLFRPIRMMADKFNTLQMGLIAADRVFKIIDNKLYHTTDGSIVFEQLNHSIIIDDVSFSYTDGQEVLSHVSFSINKGESLAIVGSTGSGKSTIIALLSRNYDTYKGKITFDGIDLRHYQLDSLRKNMTVVLQDVFLFSGSIYDNITLRLPIPREQVVAAATFCGAHDFIQQLPGAYDFNVMERGQSLSLGQRQLISIVRAVLFNPQLLILDEATSSIDTNTERLLQRAVDKVIADRTSIIIAHRLSTIQKVNRILVLEKGKIVEYGTHDELLKRNGAYSKLYATQLK